MVTRGSSLVAEWKAIVDYVNGAELDVVLAEAARVQAEATK